MVVPYELGHGILWEPELDQKRQRTKDTSGGQACAQIEAWLAEQEAARPRDWKGILTQVQKSIATLFATDLLSNDPVAQQILERMIAAPGMEEIAFEVDHLGMRVAELLAEKSDGTTPILSLRAGGPRAPLAPSIHDLNDPGEAPSRTFLRL